jgi:hypothetical protein
VKTSYQTPFGYIRSDWEKTTSGESKYTISVPKGTTALFSVISQVADAQAKKKGK